MRLVQEHCVRWQQVDAALWMGGGSVIGGEASGTLVAIFRSIVRFGVRRHSLSEEMARPSG